MTVVNNNDNDLLFLYDARQDGFVNVHNSSHNSILTFDLIKQASELKVVSHSTDLLLASIFIIMAPCRRQEADLSYARLHLRDSGG